MDCRSIESRSIHSRRKGRSGSVEVRLCGRNQGARRVAAVAPETTTVRQGQGTSHDDAKDAGRRQFFGGRLALRCLGALVHDRGGGGGGGHGCYVGLVCELRSCELQLRGGEMEMVRKGTTVDGFIYLSTSSLWISMALPEQRRSIAGYA